MSHFDTPTNPPPLPHRKETRMISPRQAPPLTDFIKKSHRSIRLETLGRTLFFLAAVTLSLIVLDVIFQVPSSLRLASWLFLALLTVALIIRHGWLPTRRYTSDRATRKIEEAHPELGQLLRTANDVAALPQPEQSGVSPQLAQTLITQAHIKLNTINLSDVLPSQKTTRWLGLGTAACFLLLLMVISWQDFRTGFARLLNPASKITFSRVEITTQRNAFTSTRLPQISATIKGRKTNEAALVIHEPDGTFTKVPMIKSADSGQFEAVLTGRRESFYYHITSGDGSSATAFMEDREPAHLLASSATISPPSYTEQPTVTLDNADVTGIEGSQVELRFEMSAPLSKAHLKFEDGTRTPLQIEDSLASFNFELQAGENVYHYEATDHQGRPVDPIAFRMNGKVDKLPNVKILDPSKDASATAIAEVPVRIRITDDLGIATFGLVLEAQGESAIILERKVTANDELKITELATAALEQFPLTIRDNVRLYAYATDRKPRGEQRAVSQLKSIDIKQFKIRSILAEPPPGGAAAPPPPPPPAAEEMAQLGDLITEQRALLSDTFIERERHVSETPSKEVTEPLANRERKIQQIAIALRTKLADQGVSQDDLALFGIASEQMGEAVVRLEESSLPLGFEREDAALSTLLELRKHLIEILMKNLPGEGPP